MSSNTRKHQAAMAMAMATTPPRGRRHSSYPILFLLAATSFIAFPVIIPTAASLAWEKRKSSHGKSIIAYYAR